MHFTFSLFDLEFWGFHDEKTISLCSITIGNWHGSLFYFYHDSSGLREGGFDFLWTAYLIHKLKRSNER